MARKQEPLPEEVLSLLEAHEIPEAKQEELDRFSSIIKTKRTEAIDARKDSGIEDTWLLCEEAYIGIDDENRAEFNGMNWNKPATMQGGLSSNKVRKNGAQNRSTAFIPLTARYVDAGSAKVAEILLPVDDKAFSFEPTPIPDLINSIEDTSQAVDEQGNSLHKGTYDAAGKQQFDANNQPVTEPYTKGEQAQKILDEATKAAEGAETQIYDWMVESQYPAQMRKVIFDSSRIGVGVLKGPFPVARQSQASSKTETGVKFIIKEEIKPGYEWRDPWNIFPDPSCGEKIENGSYVFERDYLSERQVKKLAKVPGYLPSQINKVIAEGPSNTLSSNDANSVENDGKKKKRFQVWYYHGDISRQDMDLTEAIGRDEIGQDQKQVYAIITMINDTAVRCSINPLDSGKFPYHAMPWRRRRNYWAGVGVAEQVNIAQRIVNAGTRRMLANGALSSGAQIIVGHGLEPMDNNWQIEPDKFWRMSADAVQDDVGKAFNSFTFPNMTPELMSIIEYGFRIAEESCNIPLISQGQSGKTTPDTFGAAQLQNNNANQLLRNIGYTADDCITEPIVTMSYEWLLIDPSVPEEFKGDFKINAHGSASLVERAIQDQTIVQILSMSANPIYGMNPEKAAAMLLKSKKLNPSEVEYTDDEKKSMAEAQAKQAEQGDPRIAGQIKVAQTKQEGDIAKEKLAQQTFMEDNKFKADEAEKQRAHERDMAEQTRQLELIKLAQQKGMNLEQLKAKLADTTMKLSTQVKLSDKSMQNDIASAPPTEPAGRAANGKAYQE